MADKQLSCAVTNPPTNCALHTRAYKDGQLVDEGFDPQRLSEFVDDGRIVWLDMVNPDQDDITLVTQEFDLHPLAVEDAIHPHQRPKLDRYDSHIFISMYEVHLEHRQLVTGEIAVLMTENALITVRKSPTFDIAPVVERWDGSPELMASGVAFLLWGLIDEVVDGHFGAVQDLDQQAEDLEDVIFSGSVTTKIVQKNIFGLRKNLVSLRRVSLPMREVVNSIIRYDLKIVDNATAPYFQDVYDHVLRVSEWTDSVRDLVQSLLEANLAIQSNRLNEVMKKLTAWAAIIAVPTAITGYYGQNVPFPGYGKHWAWVLSTAMIVFIAGGLWRTLKRADWL